MENIETDVDEPSLLDRFQFLTRLLSRKGAEREAWFGLHIDV